MSWRSNGRRWCGKCATRSRVSARRRFCADIALRSPSRTRVQWAISRSGASAAAVRAISVIHASSPRAVQIRIGIGGVVGADIAQAVSGRARLQGDRAPVPDQAGPRLHEPAAIRIADPGQLAVAAAIGKVAGRVGAVDALAIDGRSPRAARSTGRPGRTGASPNSLSGVAIMVREDDGQIKAGAPAEGSVRRSGRGSGRLPTRWSGAGCIA